MPRSTAAQGRRAVGSGYSRSGARGWRKKTKRAEAEAAMAEVHDPRAVPVDLEGIRRGRAGRSGAGRPSLASDRRSGGLAGAGVTGGAGRIGRASGALAAESLAKRDPREFAGLLISVLRDPIEYEVRPVGGPGKPGELYVHGERANSRFFYEAPPPLATLRPTDIVGFDSNGLPVANRVVGFGYESPAAAVDPLQQGAPDLSNAPQTLARAGLGAAGVALGQKLVKNQQDATNAGAQMARSGGGMVPMPLVAQVPVGQLMVQAQRQAEYSRARLEEDVAALKRYNQDVNQVNERATAALESAVRPKPGPQRQAWVTWWNDLVGTATAATPPPQDLDRERESSQTAAEKRAMLPSFGAGTPVWTLSGVRPVEAIRAGDQVLTQDTSTGALAFMPVVTIHHPALQPVKTITVAGAPMVVTDLERFWVAGKGWVMVLDLKPGDPIRALGGVVPVAAVEDAGARPGYHVQVAAGRGIIVGERGLLAHDELVAYPVAAAFDAAAIDGPTRHGR